jgi:anti-sigma factor RsiW
MTCQDTLELVEEIAAEEITATVEIRAHFETCPRCASALATARRIEAALAARPAPVAPAGFTAAVVSKIRSDRWRAEQHVDRLFNLAMVAGMLLIVGSVLALTNLGVVIAAAAKGGELLGTAAGQLAERAVPALRTYIAAAGLLISALGMWWWAERRLTL